MAERLLALAAAAVMVLGFLSAGTWVLKLLRLRVRGVERVVFAFGLGSGLLGLLTLGLGALGLMRLEALWALYLLSAAGGVPLVVGFESRLGERIRAMPVVGWALLGLLGAAALAALAPAVAWDSLVYHLVIPREYLRAGAVVHLPSLFQASYPLHMEMLYAPGATWANGACAQVVHVAFGAFFCLAIYAIGRRTVSPNSAALAGLLAITSPAIFVCLPTAYVDQGLAFYEAAAFLAVIRLWRKSGRWIVVAGLLAGFAAGTKVFGPRCAMALGAVVLVHCARDRRILRGLGLAAGLGAIALATYSPWLVKNAVFRGNAFFPLAIEQLGGGETSPEAYEWIRHNFVERTWPDRSMTDFLLFPTRVVGRQGPEGIVNPILFLLPLGLLLVRRRTAADHVPHLVYAFVAYVTWYLSAPLIRVYQMPFGLLALCGAAAWERGRWRAARWLLLVLAVLSTGRYLANNLRGLWRPAKAALGIVSMEEYVSGRLPTFEALRAVNGILPPDAVVLARDSRIYYLERRAVQMGLTRNGRKRLSVVDDPEEFHATLVGWGVTHTLVTDALPEHGYLKSILALEADGRLVRISEGEGWILHARVGR